MMVTIQLPQTTPFSRMEQVADQLDSARLALERETQEVAVPDANTGHMSRGVVRSWSQFVDETRIQAYVGFTPPETRPQLRSKAITRRLEELMGEVPDADQVSFSLNGNDAPAVEIAIMGENKADLEAAVEELKARLMQFSGVSSVRDSQDAAIEELRFELLPGAEQLGLSLSDVARQVRQAYFGEEVQRLPREGDDVRVYVRYPRDDRRTLESLGAFRLRTNDGREVPLAAVATWEFAPGVTGLDRRQRMSSILVTADLVGAEERKGIMDTLEKDFWTAFDAKYQTVSRRAIGEAEGEAEFFSELLGLMGLAFAAIYFLLAVTFRSYWQPVAILISVLFAIFGATMGHLLLGANFGMFSVLGIVAAIGVAVNDNVVLIDRCNQIRGYFALRLKRDGAPQPNPEHGWAVHEFAAPNGRVYEYIPISPDLEMHEEFVVQAAEAGFENGPLEVRSGAQVRHDANEHHEMALELEGLGFQVMRVRAMRAIAEASISRFRQIFLTSVTEFIGMAPMILESAVIAQFLRPMALSLAFGVLLCMPATLLLTPALYMIGIDIKRVVGGAFRGSGRLAGFYARLYGRKEKPVAAE
jgi:multidrug efflux pump subunit AcrB